MLLQLSLSLSLRPMARGEPWDTCQHRIPTLRRGAVQSRWTRGSVGAILGDEVGYKTLGHVATPEPFLSREASYGATVARGSAWMHALPFVLA
jgi:hypothetical protein